MHRVFKRLKNHFVPHRGNDYKPHLLRHNSMLVFFLVIVVCELALLTQVFIVFDKTKFLASVLPGVLTSLTNEQRTTNNLPTLKENSLLAQAAQMKANDMATRGYFSHNNPDVTTPWYWLDQVGYSYKYAGENLAVNFFESENVAQAWMNSPSHRANIVKKEYTEIGIATASGIYEGKNSVFVVQFFGTPQIKATVLKPVENAQASTQKLVVVKKKTATPTKTQTAIKTTPIATKVLGDETVATQNKSQNEIASTQTSKKISEIKLFFEKIATSPRTGVTYVYGLISLLIGSLLLIALFVKSEIRHPVIMIRGLALIGTIVILLFLNIEVFNSQATLPADSQNNTFIAN